MNKTEFHKLADNEINYLFSIIEDQDKGMILDADILDEILTITLPNNKQYVINKHGYVQQIWLSSPETGAYHFDYDKNQQRWLNGRGNELRDLLNKELTKYLIIKF